MKKLNFSDEKKNVICFGAGVQSTAICLLIFDNKIKLKKENTYFLFVDAGAEHAETYAHEKIIFQLAKKNGYKYTKLTPQENPEYFRSHIEGRNIYQYYYDNGWLPLPSSRACTVEYKDIPTRRFCMAVSGAKRKYKQIVRKFFGISADERHRATGWRRKWNAYPLIDWNLTREQCQNICLHYLGYKVRKSACFICPLTPHRDILAMYKTEPHLFAKCVELEKRKQIKYPKSPATLWHKTPACALIKKLQIQQTLTSF